jgi:hypothetical protein
MSGPNQRLYRTRGGLLNLVVRRLEVLAFEADRYGGGCKQDFFRQSAYLVVLRRAIDVRPGPFASGYAP